MTESEVPRDGLRERHRKRTATQLEEAALRLFSQRGFDAVTVDDIAAEADVCRRTFFRYFASKEDVLLSDHPRKLDELRQGLAARPPEEPVLTALRQTVLEMANSDAGNRPRILQRFKIMANTPSLQARSLVHQRMWEQALTEVVAERMGLDPAVDLRPAVVAATTLAAMRVAFLTWFESDGEADLTALVAETLDLLDGGLQAASLAPAASPRRALAGPRRPAASRGRSRAV